MKLLHTIVVLACVVCLSVIGCTQAPSVEPQPTISATATPAPTAEPTAVPATDNGSVVQDANIISAQSKAMSALTSYMTEKYSHGESLPSGKNALYFSVDLDGSIYFFVCVGNYLEYTESVPDAPDGYTFDGVSPYSGEIAETFPTGVKLYIAEMLP